jgi:hypothetical protein
MKGVLAEKWIFKALGRSQHWPAMEERRLSRGIDAVFVNKLTIDTLADARMHRETVHPDARPAM